MKISFDEEKLWIQALQSGDYEIGSSPFAEFGYKLVYIQKKRGTSAPLLSKILKKKIPQAEVEDFIREMKRKAGIE